LRTVWGTFNKFVNGYLDSVTLEDLASGRLNAESFSGSK
jgi:hypothetical protein